MTQKTYTRWEPIKGATAKTSYFTFWYTVLWLVFSLGIAQSFYTNDPRWLVLSGASIAGVHMLTDRKRLHDELQIIERQLYDAKPQTVPQHKPEPAVSPHVVTVDAPNQRQTVIGKYKMTATEAKQLESALRSNSWRFTRDCVKSAKVGSINAEIYTNWGRVRGEFERIQFVKNGECTDTFRAWLARFSTTPPRTND